MKIKNLQAGKIYQATEILNKGYFNLRGPKVILVKLLELRTDPFGEYWHCERPDGKTIQIMPSRWNLKEASELTWALE
jgi:hypothetical protein